jgi:hypothetical protein
MPRKKTETSGDTDAKKECYVCGDIATRRNMWYLSRPIQGVKDPVFWCKMCVPPEVVKAHEKYTKRPKRRGK